ncbi:hypothetical protein CsatB_023570 [Cannabis sativa]
MAIFLLLWIFGAVAIENLPICLKAIIFPFGILGSISIFLLFLKVPIHIDK